MFTDVRSFLKSTLALGRCAVVALCVFGGAALALICAVNASADRVAPALAAVSVPS